MRIDPTPDGPPIEEQLLLRVADALGYDLEKLDNRDEDYGDKCPCCQLDDLMDLILDVREEQYRKGWNHVIDGTTPPIGDLLFGNPVPKDVDPYPVKPTPPQP